MGKKTAQSPETAPNHMKTPNLTHADLTRQQEFRSKENLELVTVNRIRGIYQPPNAWCRDNGPFMGALPKY